MSGLLFRADELRDATTRAETYEQRKAWVTARVRAMPEPRYNFLASSDAQAWWLRTRHTINQTAARIVRGQRAAVEIRQRWERLPNMIRRMNNVHPIRRVK